jgi:hypothetical protein
VHRVFDPQYVPGKLQNGVLKPATGPDKRFPLQSRPANHLQGDWQTSIWAARAAPEAVELAKIKSFPGSKPFNHLLYSPPSKTMGKRFIGC